MERSEEDTQADEVRHRNKLLEEDKLKEKYRKKAERMEKINPIGQDDYVLTVEEVESIEAELPENFTDADIDRVLRKQNIDIKARRDAAKAQRDKINKP